MHVTRNKVAFYCREAAEFFSPGAVSHRLRGMTCLIL
jgi:hypothetical protein